jgi:hypothetical protein
MRSYTVRVGFVLGLLALAAFAAAQEQPPPAKPASPAPGPEVQAGDWRLSGPFTHANLTVFLVHGRDTLPGQKFLTLQEAMEQNKVVIHETKNVNELSVENSSDDEIFINTGDVIKGGQQDRILAFDFIVPPKSGKIPIPSFCVEQGRWAGRGGENADNFSGSVANANNKDLKVAAGYARSQGEVWKNVSRTQAKLGANLMQSVQAGASPTSLQLTLENKKLLEEAEMYLKELAKAPEGKKDVIGFAYAINGKVESADVYGSAALFAKMWPRLVRACAIEAIGELKKDQKFEPVKAEAVATLLADAAKGKQKDEKESGPRLKVVTQETEKNILFETRDRQGAVLHKSYVRK